MEEESHRGKSTLDSRKDHAAVSKQDLNPDLFSFRGQGCQRNAQHLPQRQRNTQGNQGLSRLAVDTRPAGPFS